MVGDAAVVEANEALDKIHELATLLDTGLDREEVTIIAALIENGVNPEVLCSLYHRISWKTEENLPHPSL